MMENSNEIENRSLLDEVLANNINDLIRMANFYHQRGDYETAQRILDSLNDIRSKEKPKSNS